MVCNFVWKRCVLSLKRWFFACARGGGERRCNSFPGRHVREQGAAGQAHTNTHTCLKRSVAGSSTPKVITWYYHPNGSRRISLLLRIHRDLLELMRGSQYHHRSIFRIIYPGLASIRGACFLPFLMMDDVLSFASCQLVFVG